MESSPLTVWINSDDAKLTAQRLQFDNPEQATSTENRNLEFDLIVKKRVYRVYSRWLALYTSVWKMGRVFTVDRISKSKFRSKLKNRRSAPAGPTGKDLLQCATS